MARVAYAKLSQSEQETYAARAKAANKPEEEEEHQDERDWSDTSDQCVTEPQVEEHHALIEGLETCVIKPGPSMQNWLQAQVFVCSNTDSTQRKKWRSNRLYRTMLQHSGEARTKRPAPGAFESRQPKRPCTEECWVQVLVCLRE